MEKMDRLSKKLLPSLSDYHAFGGRFEEKGTSNILWTIFAAFSTTAVSEIGDRSFFTAVLLSLRFDRWTVFWGVFTALLVQSCCSALFGGFITSLIPLQYQKVITCSFSCLLFGLFAYRHLAESYDEYLENQEKRLHSSSELLVSTSNIDLNDPSTAGFDTNRPTVTQTRPTKPRSMSRGLLSKLDSISSPRRLSTYPNRPAPVCADASQSDLLRIRSEELMDVQTYAPIDVGESPGDNSNEIPSSSFQQNANCTWLAAFWTAFALTYTAEIGDSSMIVTATLASTNNPFIVFLGMI